MWPKQGDLCFMHARCRRVVFGTFDLIWDDARRRLSAMEFVKQRSINAAWRRAAECWLRCQSLIAVNHPHQTNHKKNQLPPLAFQHWPHQLTIGV
jgi:hypothetical protein